MRYICTVCGYVYDEKEGEPENDIEPDTLWEDVPEDFECPMCGIAKEDFEKDPDYDEDED